MNDASHVLQTDSRERLLNLILRVSCLPGLVAFVLYLFAPVPDGTRLLVVLAVGILFVVTLWESLPYRIRTGIFLLLLYLAGVGLLHDSKAAEAAVFFFGFVAMTFLLLPSPSSIYYAVASMLFSIPVVRWLNLPPGEGPQLVGIFVGISTIVGIGLYSFQHEFIQTQRVAQQLRRRLEEERSVMEQRVEEQTAGLRRKSEELLAAALITRRTAAVQDLHLLLSTAAELIAGHFQFYHAGIFLLNASGNQAVLQASSSEGGRRMIAGEYSVAVGTQDIVGSVAAQRKPRIALDIGTDAVVFNNPELPMTRSEVALPLLVSDQVLGVLDIHSQVPQAFGMDDIDILQTLADQIAIAIENARLIDEAREAIHQLEALTGSRTRDAWSQKLLERDRVFTYTPLGLRAEKLSQSNEDAITAPILLRGQKIGNISVARRKNGSWSRLDKDVLDEVAGQVGLAVDNIRLLEEANQRARQEQAVGRLAARFSQSLDLDTLLQAAAHELGQLPDVVEASVTISQDGEQDHQSRIRASGRPAQGYQSGAKGTEPVTQFSKLAVTAMRSGTIMKSNGSTSVINGEQQFVVPIKLRGKTIGAADLRLMDGYDSSTLSVIQLAAERLAAAMESARLYEEARLRADREQAISRVTSAISSATEYDEILKTAIREIGNILADTEVSVRILEPMAAPKLDGQKEQ
jgi:GAF domain-containing protein